MSRQGHARRLVIAGGGEDKTDTCVILGELVRLAGGRRAHLVVLTVASGNPHETGPEYDEVLRRLGAGEVHILHLDAREDANAPELVAAVERATGAFFTGGDQMRITGLLGGSKLEAALLAGFQAGTVIGGTSAGAAVMPSIMIASGRNRSSPRLEGVDLSPGMGFLPGTLIDQHFAQRGRIGRLLTAVAHHPRFLGLGIDENTAMVVEGDEFHVIGDGAVTVIDAANLLYTNVHDSAAEDECLALCGITLHVLPAGLRFHLAERRPILPATTVP